MRDLELIGCHPQGTAQLSLDCFFLPILPRMGIHSTESGKGHRGSGSGSSLGSSVRSFDGTFGRWEGTTDGTLAVILVYMAFDDCQQVVRRLSGACRKGSDGCQKAVSG